MHISQMVYFSVSVCDTVPLLMALSLTSSMRVIACECEHACVMSRLLLLGKQLKHQVYSFTHLQENKYGLKWLKARSYYYSWFNLPLKSSIISIRVYVHAYGQTLVSHSLHLYPWNKLSRNVAVVSFRKQPVIKFQRTALWFAVRDCCCKLIGGSSQV